MEDLPIRGVVVDDEHRRSSSNDGRPAASAHRRRARRPNRAVKWKVLPRPGSLSTPDRPAHQLDEPRGDRQPQAGAAVPPRRRAVRLLEGVEDRRLLLGRDADARVA